MIRLLTIGAAVLAASSAFAAPLIITYSGLIRTVSDAEPGINVGDRVNGTITINSATRTNLISNTSSDYVLDYSWVVNVGSTTVTMNRPLTGTNAYVFDGNGTQPDQLLIYGSSTDDDFDTDFAMINLQDPTGNSLTENLFPGTIPAGLLPYEDANSFSYPGTFLTRSGMFLQHGIDTFEVTGSINVVPEPATVAALGLGWVAALRRRRAA